MLAAPVVAAALYAGSTGAAVSAAAPARPHDMPDLTVGRAELEQAVRNMYDPHLKTPISNVVCDGSLAAKVGATQRCAVTQAGKTYGGEVTMDGVRADWVHFHALFRGLDFDH